VDGPTPFPSTAIALAQGYITWANLERTDPCAECWRVSAWGGELEFCELGTPLTNDHYLNSHRGNLYGAAKTRFQVGPFAFPVKTEIAGLYHCGASTVAHGVMGVLMSGIWAAKAILGCRTRDLLTHEDQGKITLLPPSTTTPVLPAREGEHEMSHV